jgi:hypothetical protein
MNIRVRVIILGVLLLLSNCVKGVIVNYENLKNTSDSILTTKRLVGVIEKMEKIHPNLYAYYPKDSVKILINELQQFLPSDKINETDFIFYCRHVFDSITRGDPHFKMLPTFRGFKNFKAKKVRVPPFSFININDTLLVDNSFSELINMGDIILKINNISSQEYLKYNYSDRYIDSPTLLANYYFRYSDSYDVQLVRDKDSLSLKIRGMPLFKYMKNGYRVNKNIYGAYRVGYFEINRFDNNKVLIRELSNFIKSTGYKDIIIDLRRNSGGSGEDFDKLFSLFTNKRQIKYQKNCKVKVSKSTLDYGFTEDQIGKLLDLPDSLIHREVKLDSKLWLGNRNYYFLVSNYTASMAASFVNTIQYNGIGSLVGEPLAYNALKFGEVVIANFRNSVLSISTSVMDDFSLSTDGVVRPGVSVPYVASDYIGGRDPILEKCLEYIFRERNSGN